MLEAGRRDRKIIIQHNTGSVKDELGKDIPSWVTKHECWAEYNPIGGQELLNMGKEVSTEVSRFVILYKSDLLETDRISFNGKFWDILFFRELGRREGLEITAQVHR